VRAAVRVRRVFDEVYAGIVEALVAAALEAAPEPVLYAVPGSPLVAVAQRSQFTQPESPLT